MLSERYKPTIGRILVVDDDPIALEHIAETLRHIGFDVTTTETPIGVTRLALRSGFDAIVMDVHMPALRGDRLMRVIGDNPRLASLPIVFVSSSNDIDPETLGGAALVHKRDLERDLPTALFAALD